MSGTAISRRERLIVLIIAFVIVAAMQTPYVLGYLLAQPGTEYTGLLINVEDASYLSAIGQGIKGAWLYKIPFTTEQHEPVFIETFYLALGHVARLCNLSAVAMWHWARVVAAMMMFLTVYGFIAQWIHSAEQRRLAYLIAILTAGFDWFRFPFDAPNVWEAVPIERQVAEAHLFFSAMTYPHFGISIVLMLVAFSFLVAMLIPAQPSNPWRLAVGIGVANLLLGIIYPFLIYLMCAVTGTFFLFLVWREKIIQRRLVFWLGVVFAIPAPLFLYYLVVLINNPIIAFWNAQATTVSPNPLHWILTYAPLLVFAFMTRRAIASMDELSKRRWMFLWIWVSVVAILIYAPITQQRRFIEGVQVPLAILATLGLTQVVFPRLEQTRVFIQQSQRPGYSIAGLRRLITLGIVTVMSLSSLYVWMGSVITLAIAQPYPLFRPVAELQVMDWLRANTASNDTIFSAYWTGSWIPVQADRRVFIGQRYETIRFDSKRRDTERFFDSATDDLWRMNLLRENRLAYVFWGQGERDLGAFDPNRANYLKPVYGNSAATIFQVLQ
jgi:hypothetical protein